MQRKAQHYGCITSYDETDQLLLISHKGVHADLHAEVREYIEQHGMTMAEFITLAVDNELHPKYQNKEEKNICDMVRTGQSLTNIYETYKTAAQMKLDTINKFFAQNTGS